MNAIQNLLCLMKHSTQVVFYTCDAIVSTMYAVAQKTEMWKLVA
jgi:hypothetical protein